MEHSIAQRATAAETLAYLTEVDSNLQQIAAISNQLISALLDLLTCGSTAARIAAFRYKFRTKWGRFQANDCIFQDVCVIGRQ